MDYAYVKENSGPKDTRSNTELFKVIQKLEIPEERVLFAEEDGVRTLIDELRFGDRVFILSIMDLASNFSELQKNLEELQKYGTILYSIKEPILRGDNYCEILDQTSSIILGFRELKRRKNYETALQEQRIGRPKKTEQIDMANKLLEMGLTVSQVSKLVNLSSSTIYKNISKQKTSYKSTYTNSRN